jgi:thiol:disulfide interchange protein
MPILNSFRYLLCGLLLALPVTPGWAAAVQTPHVEAELVSETTTLLRGDNSLALRLKPDAGWHTYWRNPGDTGQPTKIEWTLPSGVTAGDIQWPYPHSFRLGDLTNYGYGEETLLPVTLRVPQSWPALKPLKVLARARWLVCADVCIPGHAELSLELPVTASAQVNGAWQNAFARTRNQLPQAMDALHASFAIEKGRISVQVYGQDFRGTQVEFFPIQPRLFATRTEPALALESNALRLTQNLSEDFSGAPEHVGGVLVVSRNGTRNAYAIDAVPGTVAAVTTAAPPTHNLLLILILAVLGGLTLNLMPCVFPVLSLKAMALMQQRDASAKQQRHHALAYTAGVMLSCAAVAGVLLALRAGGEAIGWGFQLQSPIFVAALAYLMFALGLSLSGVVEFGGRFMGIGQSLTVGNSSNSSFFTGVLATVVASPCTAPFMGTALGYAVTQSPLIAMCVFFALGFGLALPFLLLGFFPRLAALLPRPGAWMETFKQAMAFPLYLTVVWLVWVVMQQSGSDAAALTLIGLVLLAFALWLWPRPARAAMLLKITALAGAALLLAHPALRADKLAPSKPGAEQTEAYSDARLAQLRAEKRSVFVNLTADWCLTCKVNEHAALGSDKARDAFTQKNVAVLIGDWTRSDAAITKVLERYGRNGVPLYLLSVNGGEPKVLPQILTPQIVLDALHE